MEASIGTAATIQGGNAIRSYRALNPRKPDVINAPRSKRGGGRRRSSGSRTNNVSSGALTEQPQVSDEALRTKTAVETLAAENAELDLDIARSISDDKKKFSEGDMQNKMFDVQNTQIGNIFKAAKMTSDENGVSEFSGQMWDEARSFGGKGVGAVGQFYDGEDGEKRFRMMRKTGGVALNEGEYTSQPGFEPLEFQGKPVDFSVEALSTMFPDQDQPKAEYQTTEGGDRVLVQGTKAKTVTGEDGAALKVRSDKTQPASIQEADHLFNRMKQLPGNKGRSENELWMEAWNKSNQKTADSPENLKAKFYQDTLKKLLPEGRASGEKADEARKVAEQLTQHFEQTYLKSNQQSALNSQSDAGEQPPMAGARKAKDGKWYVQKDGKWNLVEQ